MPPTNAGSPTYPSGPLPAPPEARLPTKAHDRRFICPASLRIAPPYTCSPPKSGERGVCATLPTKEQLVAFTVPWTLSIAPPLGCRFQCHSGGKPVMIYRVAVFERKVTPVRLTVPPRFRIPEPPRLVVSATTRLTTVKLTLGLTLNTGAP